jgi:hypothetical protein
MTGDRILAVLVAGILAAQLAPALAVGGAGTGQARPAPQPAPTQPGQQPEPVQVVQQGVVTALSSQGDHVVIQGKVHFIAAGKTRFYRNGQVVAADALKIGQNLKYTLVASSGERPTLGTVYVP